MTHRICPWISTVRASQTRAGPAGAAPGAGSLPRQSYPYWFSLKHHDDTPQPEGRLPEFD
jgi:hypothetical protein